MPSFCSPSNDKVGFLKDPRTAEDMYALDHWKEEQDKILDADPELKAAFEEEEKKNAEQRRKEEEEENYPKLAFDYELTDKLYCMATEKAKEKFHNKLSSEEKQEYAEKAKEANEKTLKYFRQHNEVVYDSEEEYKNAMAALKN